MPSSWVKAVSPGLMTVWNEYDSGPAKACMPATRTALLQKRKARIRILSFASVSFAWQFSVVYLPPAPRSCLITHVLFTQVARFGVLDYGCRWKRRPPHLSHSRISLRSPKCISRNSLGAQLPDYRLLNREIPIFVFHPHGDRVLTPAGVETKLVIQFWRVGKPRHRRRHFPFAAIQRILRFS